MDETDEPVSLGCSKAFCQNSTLLEEQAVGVYGARPVLYSVRNSTRLAVESTRARCAVPVEPPAPPAPAAPAPPPAVRDFTAYFQGSPDCDPSYAASHTAPELDTRSRVIPAYPVGQSLRWHPYVETSSIEDISYGEKESKTCRCTKCTSKNCPSKTSSSSTLKSGCARSNIMKFTDIYTMTPRLTDTACGSCIVSSARRHEVATNGSDAALRDSKNSRSHSRTKCGPTSILKYPRRRRICDYNDVYADDNYCEECDDQPSKRRYESGQDSCDNGPSRSCSRYSFHGRHRKDEPAEACNRDVIYNEGVSDQIRHLCRLPATCDELEYSAPAPCSRGRWRLRPCSQHEPIPHAHRYNSSRYHRACKHSRSKVWVLEEQCAPCPPAPHPPPRRTCSPAPYNFHYAPCIKLPRKVLTSEVDIDHFVDPRCPLTRYHCARRNF